MTPAPSISSGVAADCILALDATGDDCAALVWRAGRGAVAEIREPMPRGGGADMAVDVIGKAVVAAGLEWPSIDAIAVVTGPGSFTGVRIGVAAARALALSLNVPAIGVDAFEAISTAVAEDRSGVAEGATFVVVFGRPARLVWRRYEARNGCAYVSGNSESGSADDLQQLAVDFVVGPAAEAAEPLRAQVRQPDLTTVARIAAMRAAEGDLEAPAPLYLRAPDAKPPSLSSPVRLDQR